MASTTDKPGASTAADSSAEANPTKTVDAASPSTDKSDPPSDFTYPDADVSVKESEGSKTTGTAAGLVAGERGGPVNVIQNVFSLSSFFTMLSFQPQNS